MDAQEWSSLTRLREVFERLRPGVVVFRNELGRELFDLPDAPRPEPATPAPIRFLPQYDNVLLGHADRSRLVPDEVRAARWPEVWVASFLVDGMVAGTWRTAGTGKVADLELDPFAELSEAQRLQLATEGYALLVFLRGGADAGQVRFARSG